MMTVTQKEVDYHAHQGQMNYLRQQSSLLTEKREALEITLNATIEQQKSIKERMKTLAETFEIRKANKGALEEIERLKALLAEKTET
ncbi:MAG: hypothetical protein GQ569_12210 [Methylococcaceae bacterium]|nr:hypothetical protein [Methylococcaceae bacterium]